MEKMTCRFHFTDGTWAVLQITKAQYDEQMRKSHIRSIQIIDK